MISTPPNLPSDTVDSVFNPQTSITSREESGASTFTVTNTWSEVSTFPLLRTSIGSPASETTTSLSSPSSATTTSSLGSKTPTPTQHPVNSSAPSSSDNLPHTPIIVGVLVGISVFIILLGSAIILWVRRSKRRDAAESDEVKATKLTPFLGVNSFSGSELPEGGMTGCRQSEDKTPSVVLTPRVRNSSRSRSHIIDLSSERAEYTGRYIASRIKTSQEVEERLNKVMQKLEIIEAAIQLHTHGWEPSGQGKGNVDHHPKVSRSRQTIGVDAVDDRPPRYASKLDLATSSEWTTDIASKDLNRMV